MSRRTVMTGVFVGLAMLVVLDAIAVRLGVAAGVVPTVDGPAPWLIPRASGITALVALTLDMAFGLFVSRHLADRFLPRARSMEAHRWLSSVTLALVAAHALVLVVDRFVRFDVLDALVPFLSSYRPVAVGLGVLAAYGALVVQLSFDFKKRLGHKAWRKLHYLSFAVYAAAVVHAIVV